MSRATVFVVRSPSRRVTDGIISVAIFCFYRALGPLQVPTLLVRSCATRKPWEPIHDQLCDLDRIAGQLFT